MEALNRAIKAVGGVGALARGLRLASESNICNWRARGTPVPAGLCPSIERETRAAAALKGDPSLIVTCEELRPDIEWYVLRCKAA